MAKRFTIYDMMEERGVFTSNPANPNSRDAEGLALYKGPVEYPKMFYHPEGEERVLVPGSTEVLPGNRLVEVPPQKELISTVANNLEEEEELRAAGWHDHPAYAMAAAGKPMPAVGAAGYIQTLEQQLAKANKELAAAKEIAAVQAARSAKGKAAGGAD